MLVALKCDLREKHADDEEDEQVGSSGVDRDENAGEKKNFIEYQQGLEVARRIGALRYLGEYPYSFCIHALPL